MVNYEKEILDCLLDKYESGKAFMNGEPSRRIMVHRSKIKSFRKTYENIDTKILFHDALQRLKDRDLINFSWEKYEAGNIVDEIWLNPDPERLLESCRRAGRKPKAQILRELEAVLDEALSSCRGRSSEGSDGLDLYRFLQRQKETIQEKKRVPRYFFADDPERNRALLRFLRELMFNDGEEMERVVSMRLYGDSKYFEHELKPKALSVLRAVAKEEQDGDLNDADLLLQRGIVRWPEVLEFRGSVQTESDDGEIADYAAQRYGAYLNTDALRHVRNVNVRGISRMITIENKANYIWYIQNHHHAQELVVYHGGCCSPMKGRWLRMLADAVRRQNPKAEFLHWSDIDAGGFRIFVQLKDHLIPEAAPWHMDVDTLVKYKARAVSLRTDSYRRLLEQMQKDPEYMVFRETLSCMLEQDIRLEQEAEIL
jgi:hypothetical protein